MKHFISIVIIVMCCILLGPVPSFAQTGSSQEDEQIDNELMPTKTEVLEPVDLAQNFRTLLKEDEEVKAIDSHLKKMNFVAQVEPERKVAVTKKKETNFWGYRQTYQSKTGEKGTFTVQLHSYLKRGSKDSAALGRVVVIVGERSDVYSFYLFAPGGNFRAMEEYRIDNNLKIVKANSWWSCVQSYIRRKCPSICTQALITCLPTAPTVVGYIGCVVSTCASDCAFGSLTSCACDCRWWCKRAVGCWRR